VSDDTKGALDWIEIVAGALSIAATVARAVGGAQGAEVARRVEDVLIDFPTLRRRAAEITSEAARRLRTTPVGAP
jgi:hypothetical protein